MKFEDADNYGRYSTIPVSEFLRVDERYSVRRDPIYNILIIRDDKRKGYWKRGIFIPENTLEGRSLSIK